MITVEDLRRRMKDIEWNVDALALSEDMPLTDQGLDSLDMVTFYFKCEEWFGLKIPDADLPRLGSLRDCAGYLNSRLHGR